MRPLRASCNILFSTLILSMVLCSCVTEPSAFQAKLNIVSLINPDDAFEVIIHSTAPALGSHDNLEVDNAEVYIKNNQTQEVNLLTNSGMGVYTSNGVKPIPGYDYEIQVRAPGFSETYAATTHVPDLDNVSVYVPANQSGKENLTFSFSANNTSRFFAYELIYSGNEIPEEDTPEEETSIDPGSQFVNDNFKVDRLLPIEGAVSDGTTTTVNSPNTITPKGELAQLKDVSLRIVAVSPQYYEYLMLEKKPDGPHYSSVYFEESQVFSNFIGGAYGIFGGFNERTIKLEE